VAPAGQATPGRVEGVTGPGAGVLSRFGIRR